MFKKYFILLLVLLCAFPIIAGGSEENMDGKTVVTFWEQRKQEEYRDVLQTEFVDTFNQAHDDIFLELTIQEDIERLLRTAVQGGEGPDIIYQKGPAQMYNYVEAGAVIPLNDYIENFDWDTSEFFSWAIDVGTIDGNIYSLPLTYESMLLWYNKTLFEENGWEVPTNREELEELCSEMMDKGIIPFCIGNAGFRNINEWFISVFLNAYAGPEVVYDLFTGKISWTDPLIQESISLLNEYFQKGWFGGSVEDYFALGYDDSWRMFSEGIGAMQISGTWSFSNAAVSFEQSGQEWDCVKFPSLREGVTAVYPLAIGNCVGINADSANPDAAAAVIDWIYKDPVRAAKIIEGLDGSEWVLPRTFSEEDLSSIDMDYRWKEFTKEFSDDSANGLFGYTTWTFLPPKTDIFLYETFDSLIIGDMSVEEYCGKVQEVFAEELAEGKVIPIPSPGN